MKIAELRNITPAELSKKVLELQKRLSDIRFKATANQIKNVKEVSNIKKDIARKMTVMNEAKKTN